MPTLKQYVRYYIPVTFYDNIEKVMKNGFSELWPLTSNGNPIALSVLRKNSLSLTSYPLLKMSCTIVYCNPPQLDHFTEQYVETSLDETLKVSNGTLITKRELSVKTKLFSRQHPHYLCQNSGYSDTEKQMIVNHIKEENTFKGRQGEVVLLDNLPCLLEQIKSSAGDEYFYKFPDGIKQQFNLPTFVDIIVDHHH